MGYFLIPILLVSFHSNTKKIPTIIKWSTTYQIQTKKYSSQQHVWIRFPSELDDMFDDRQFGTTPHSHNGSLIPDAGNQHENRTFVPLSDSVRREFQCPGNRAVTVQVNPIIRFNVRSMGSWPEATLKRKRPGQEQKGYQHRKTFGGCIGKRLGHSSLSKKRKPFSLLSCSFESIVL